MVCVDSSNQDSSHSPERRQRLIADSCESRRMSLSLLTRGARTTSINAFRSGSPSSLNGRELMRLADFISANLEPILLEWDAFARSINSGATMDSLALRDHAREILLATVRDMRTAQS